MGKYDAKTPCKSCPYRKDAPLAFWNEAEFLNLERTEADQMGAVFGCHQDGKKPKDEVGVCVGWLLNQKKRGLPSMRLRLALIKDRQLTEQANLVHSKGIRMFRTVSAMVKANLKAIRAQRQVT